MHFTCDNTVSFPKSGHIYSCLINKVTTNNAVTNKLVQVNKLTTFTCMVSLSVGLM